MTQGHVTGHREPWSYLKNQLANREVRAMSETKKVYHTTDPILLEALNAPENALIANASKSKKNGDSPYRGVSKKGQNGWWRCEVGVGGKDYNLGNYATDHEAALARNYGEALIPGAKKVNNQIPPGKITPEMQKKVAAEVVARLRGYGVLPSVERNGDKASEVAAGSAPQKAQPPQSSVPVDPMAQREQIVKEFQDAADASRKVK